jgi:hypothetical protein
MQRILSKITMGVAALIVSTSLAAAQTAPAPAAAPKAATPPAAAAPKAPAKAKGVPKQASTPEGIECSKQADAKGLKGKERKSFRGKCVRDLKKAAKGAAPAKAAAPAPAPAKKN